ncbi:MAG: toprim domain-containing protein [Acidimicrobiia bacterium]|nr:toprim domain-containing protein [Acidimicrobiia bacterium]
MASETFVDCSNELGVGTRELFVVEGISAANAAVVARDVRTQAVLAVQGKPLNVERASPRTIVENDKLRAIVRAVGAWSGDAFDLDSVRYDNVLILTDGDADGVHASALLLLAFDWLMPELISSGRLVRVRAPLFAIRAAQLTDAVYAYSAPHRDRVMEAMREQSLTGIDIDYLKSIAGLNAEELWRVCLNPATRVATVLSRADAASARKTLAQFGRST